MPETEVTDGQLPFFSVLGHLEVTTEHGPLWVNGSVQRRVLTMLLLEAGRVVPVSRLVEAAWDGSPPESATHQIRKTVAKLRHRIPHGPRLIVTDGAGYRAAIDHTRLDLLRYRGLLRQARESLRGGHRDQAADHLSCALDLWRGPVLAGEGGPVIGAASTALEEQRLAAAEQLYQLRLEAGEAAQITGELRALVESHPLRETLRGQLMLALYQSGQQAAALAEFDRTRLLLSDALGIDPSAELTELHQRILRQDDTLDRASAEPAPTRTHGTGAPHALPYDIADFCGRTTEFDRISALAAQAGTAAPTVVVIDGMAGTGKTTLAVRAAHRLAAHYPDGQLFVDLRGFTPGQAPLDGFTAQGDLLAAVGFAGEDIPASPAGRSSLWQSYMSGRRMLVVLDNAADSDQVRDIVPASSASLVLVTSRPRLIGLEGAGCLTLSPLTAQAGHEILKRVLGCERVAREPEAARELVRLCGGLPLAIRIAAARLAGRPRWSLERLVDRLRDHSRRLDELSGASKGVAGALTLSYQSLSPADRKAFRLLGHHPGQYIDAEEAAALLGTDPLDAEDILDGFVDIRLLEAREPGTYTFHDLVRAFARKTAQAQERPEDGPAVERLLDHYVQTARHACDLLFPGRRHFGARTDAAPPRPSPFPDGHTALRWLDQHRDSLLKSVELAHDRGLLTHAARLPRELSFHSGIRNYEVQANQALSTGVAASRELDDAALTRLNLMNLAMGYWRLGRLDDAVAHLQEALALARTLQDPRSEAECLARLGQAYSSQGAYERALRFSEEANRKAKETGFTRLDASSMSTLSYTQLRLGRFTDAVASAETALAAFASLGEIPLSVDALIYLARALAGAGRADAGLARADEAVERCTRMRVPALKPLALASQSELLLRLGRRQEAFTSITAALSETVHSAHDIHRASVHLAAARVHRALGEQAAARHQYELARENAERMQLRHEQANALTGLAAVAEAESDHRKARQHREQADALYALMGLPHTAREEEAACGPHST